MSSAITGYAANENGKQRFQKVSDEYLDQVYFHYGPTGGTLAGYHQYDAQLEDFSRKSIDAEISALVDLSSLCYYTPFQQAKNPQKVKANPRAAPCRVMSFTNLSPKS